MGDYFFLYGKTEVKRWFFLNIFDKMQKKWPIFFSSAEFHSWAEGMLFFYWMKFAGFICGRVLKS